MNSELELQKLLKDSIITHGGVAFKAANKFLIGIPDLFIHQPGRGAGLWECKVSTQFRNSDNVFVQLTPLQNKFLETLSGRGGLCGVVSFVRGHKDLLMLARPYAAWVPHIDFDMKAVTFRSSIREHHVIPRGERIQSVHKIFNLG